LNTDNIPRPALREASAEHVHVAESSISEHAMVTHACSTSSVELLKSHLPLRAEQDIVGNAGFAAALRLVVNCRIE
jgi:hypothetical protein